MRLSYSKSKNSTSVYVIKSVYKKGGSSTKVVEKLGTIEELSKKLKGEDPIRWAEEYVKELNRKEKEASRDVLVKYSPTKIIDRDEQRSYNCGYLFLQKIYHELRLDVICEKISAKYKFEYNLHSILSRLVYGRIIFPSSKLTTYQLSEKFIEQPDFELHQIYRSLEVIAKETDYIQEEIYANSLQISKRNTGLLYYDCTNYFFEIEQEEGLKQYGYGKDHKPNPLVQMGLFMDGDGVPLAFSITKGNMNEQITLKPLEKKILEDFNLSKFIVCTDAGLASTANRKFNTKGDRAFITTQSVKKLKSHLKEWALDPNGWKCDGENKTFNINELDDEKHKETTFYKERWINEDGLEQKLIITYSLKYKNYQRKIRDRQIERAKKLINSNPTKLKKANQNDYKRFILKQQFTKDGEIAEKKTYSIDKDLIIKEETFDGFYGVCTNLEDGATDIIKINHRRWEIEECFRIMKSEFKARPVYLKNDDRIEAHFTTCFISLIIYRYLEKRLNEQFTYHEIITGLREMNLYRVDNEGYIPTYTRTDFTDALHDSFGFRTDYQIVNTKKMKYILSITNTK